MTDTLLRTGLHLALVRRQRGRCRALQLGAAAHLQRMRTHGDDGRRWLYAAVATALLHRLAVACAIGGISGEELKLNQ